MWGPRRSAPPRARAGTAASRARRTRGACAAVASTGWRSFTEMRSRLASAALFFLLAVVLFWQAAVGGKVLSGSDLLLFEPPFAPPPGLTRASNEFLFDAAYVFEPDQLQVR